MEKELTNLKVLLLEDDLPAYQIAAKCGIHPSQLSRYALHQEKIKPKHLRALCHYFGLPQYKVLGTSVFEYTPQEADDAAQ